MKSINYLRIRLYVRIIMLYKNIDIMKTMLNYLLKSDICDILLPKANSHR